jgi:hypothetical protein
MGFQQHRDHPNEHTQLRGILVNHAALTFSEYLTGDGQRKLAQFAQYSEE